MKHKYSQYNCSTGLMRLISISTLTMLISTMSMIQAADKSEPLTKITIAYPPFPPFYEDVDGQHGGVCPGAIKHIFSDRQDYTLDEKPLPLPRIMRGLMQGDIDVAGCLPCGIPQLKEHAADSVASIFEPILLFYSKAGDIGAELETERDKYYGATVRQATTERFIHPEKVALLDSWTSLIQFVHRRRADYGVIPESILAKIVESESDFKFYSHFKTQPVDIIKACVIISNQSQFKSELDTVNKILRQHYKTEYGDESK